MNVTVKAPWYSSVARETMPTICNGAAEANFPTAAISVSERHTLRHRIAARHPGRSAGLAVLLVVKRGNHWYSGTCFRDQRFPAAITVECHAYPDTVNRTAGLDCRLLKHLYVFQWWLYIMGNLTGLATPLTEITVASSHVFSEIIDVLVAVWSLTLAGLVRRVGGLRVINVIVNRSDATFMNRFKRVFGVETIQDKHDREEDAHKQDLMDAVRAIQRSVERSAKRSTRRRSGATPSPAARRIDAGKHDPEHVHDAASINKV